MSWKTEEAKKIFAQGFNCSQAVLSVFCEEYGMQKEQALQIACGFGGGMRSGEICGAVSGAVMVIGLKYGADKQLCYQKTVEFRNAFQERNKSIICHDLLGYDISTEDGMEQAREKGLFQTTCVDMIADSVCLLEELEF